MQPSVSSTLRPTGVSKEVVLAKCDYFLDLSLWPLREHCDPARWLRNFLPAEQEHAVYLLHSFQFFSDALTDELFQAAFQSLSLSVVDPEEPLLTAQTKWRTFLDRAIVTRVEGEEANDSDSGFGFVRRARQLIDIPQDRLMNNADALSALLTRGPAPVIFVDDFVGSGNQFLTTWNRPRQLASPRIETSFADLAKKGTGQFYYCPLIAAASGIARIAALCPELSLQPLHILTDRDSALSPKSHIWPDHLLPTAVPFIEAASTRAGIPDWKGFDDLGLTIGFRHTIPDATLPMFYWDQNGWAPLVRRT